MSLLVGPELPKSFVVKPPPKFSPHAVDDQLSWLKSAAQKLRPGPLPEKVTVQGVSLHRAADGKLPEGFFKYCEEGGCSRGLIVCSRPEEDDEEWEQTLKVVRRLQEDPDDGIDRVVVWAPPEKDFYLMELGESTAENILMHTLGEAESLSFMADVVRTLRVMLKKHRILTVDVCLKNFVLLRRKDGSSRLLLIDFGGYACVDDENDTFIQSAAYTYRSPLIPPLMDVECNESNCLYACGVMLLQIVSKQAAVSVTEEGARTKRMFDASEALTRSNWKAAVEALRAANFSEKFWAAACSLLNFDGEKFKPTQGRGAEKRTLRGAEKMLRDSEEVLRRGPRAPRSSRLAER